MIDDDQRIIKELLPTGRWGTTGRAVATSLRSNFKCVYCNFDFYASPEAYKQIEFDHLVPTSSGGPDDPDNRVLACRTCNYCFKSRWDPRKDAGENATRDDLIAAAKRYIGERKQLVKEWITAERAVIEKDGRKL